MKLTVTERLVALQILPEKGNYATLKIVDDLRKKLSFDEKEIKKLKIKVEGDKIQWDSQIDGEGQEKEFGDFEKQLIVDNLKSIDEKKELEQKHMTLFEKFIK